jgi:CBS domain-containing protein
MVTVRDLMQTEVVTAAPEMTARELARILADGGISGLPVVTPAGEVLGVASASDLVRLAAEEQEIRMSSARWVPTPGSGSGADPDLEDEPDDPFSSFFLPEDAPVLSPEWSRMGDEEGPLDRLTVSDIMTPVSFSVSPDASTEELAQFLVRGRIHRAVVMEDGRLLGIVTTMDVLRALADGKI